MNGLENLVIGREYKYKELCALFGEKVKTSNSKKAQLKEWERFIRWTNPIPTKYRIEEIYEIPKEKLDGRKNNGGNSTTKYSILEDVLMDYFIEKKEEKCTIPKLAVEIGILSEQYSIYHYNTSKLNKDFGVNIDIANAYFSSVQSCVLDAIESALKRLQKKGFIDYSNYYVVVLENGRKKVFSGEKKKEITDIENIVRREMEISVMQSFQPEYRADFNKKVNKRISDIIKEKVNYRYKENDIKVKNEHYDYIRNEDIRRTTRKFIITIGISMLRYILYKHKKFEKESISQSELIRHVIELSNCFFVHMDYDSWDEFYNEEEFKNDDYATIFITQYCLVKMHIDMDKKRAAEKVAHEISERLDTLKNFDFDLLSE